MKEIELILSAWGKSDEELVLATVVGTSGSTYRKSGARMLLSRTKWMAGSISGGCLEGDLMEQAWTRTKAGPAIITYDATSSDDIIWGFGLGCAGSVRVLVERVGPDDSFLGLLAQCKSTQASCAVQTVVDGARLGERWASGGGSTIGDIDSIQGQPLFAEIISPPLPLVVFGAGHDAIPLVRIAKELGWDVTVADHRATFTNLERFPEADRALAVRPEDFSARIALTPRTHVVLMSHNYLQDLAVLEQCVASPVPYIGLLGPRARRERLISELKHPQCLERLKGPVGLPLGAQGPEEIALSIAAEILANHRSPDVP